MGFSIKRMRRSRLDLSSSKSDLRLGVGVRGVGGEGFADSGEWWEVRGGR